MQSSKRIGAGVDEAGRGPLAGPVVACAAVFLPKYSPKLNLVKDSLRRARNPRLKDSKQLSSKQREDWYHLFLKDPHVQWGIGRVSEKTIDRINIHQAALLAMKLAVQALQRKLKEIKFTLVIDGKFTIDYPVPQKAMVKADEKILVCTVASIIAKVTRDRLMIRYHKRYPKYGFAQHKGYGTKLHFQRIHRHGPSPIHRKSFGSGLY